MTGILYNEKFPKNILILPSRPRSTHFRFGQNVFMKRVLVSTFSRFSNFPLVRKIETKHKRNSWVERESNKKKRKLIQRQKRRNNLSTIDEFTSIQIVQHIIIYIHIILGNYPFLPLLIFKHSTILHPFTKSIYISNFSNHSIFTTKQYIISK